MKEVRGNLWDFYYKGEPIAITTNGTITKDGRGVMGRGVALQASERFADIRWMLADRLRAKGNVFQYLAYGIWMFPVKHHWNEVADLKLINRSMHAMAMFLERTQMHMYMVRPGCGNGQRNWETEVKPLLKNYCDQLIIVEGP